MAKAQARLSIVGDKALMKKLAKLKAGAQRRVVRKAVTAMLSPVVKAAKAAAPKETGLLRKSIGKKTVTYARKNTVVGIVGPRSSVVGTGPDGGKRWPVKYAHLVEYGTRHSEAQSFLRAALTATRDRVRSIFADKVASGLKQEAKR
jgi:HK97 gp10 family phage protein